MSDPEGRTPEQEGQQVICPTCRQPLGRMALNGSVVPEGQEGGITVVRGDLPFQRDSSLGTAIMFVQSQQGKALDAEGMDPDTLPGSYLSSRIPTGINDDGSIRYS